MSDSTQALVSITRFGGPEGLVVQRDLSVPSPGRGHVRVRVEAASVQYTDTMIRRGEYPT